MFRGQGDDFGLQFIQPVLEQDQQVRVGHGHELLGLGHPVHQGLTHMRWIDTFVQAFRQSEVHQAGHLVVAGAADEFDSRNSRRSSSETAGRSFFSAAAISSRAASGGMRSNSSWIPAICGENHLSPWLFKSSSCAASRSVARSFNAAKISRMLGVGHFVIHEGAAPLHLDQQGPPQFLQVVGHQRLRQVQCLDDAGDGLFAVH